MTDDVRVSSHLRRRLPRIGKPAPRLVSRLKDAKVQVKSAKQKLKEAHRELKRAQDEARADVEEAKAGVRRAKTDLSDAKEVVRRLKREQRLPPPPSQAPTPSVRMTPAAPPDVQAALIRRRPK